MTQQKALEILKSGTNVFLTGEPGSGKTYTVNLFKAWLRDQRSVYAVTASTGIAATHINGMTVHSWSGLGIKKVMTEKDLERLLEKPYVVNRIMRADVLIIDEISMLDAKTVDAIDTILRRLRGGIFSENDGKPFGGIQIVFVGDFFQLPPVSRNEKVQFAFESKAWQSANLSVCYLTEQHRQSDTRFLEILTAIRRGDSTPDHRKTLLLKRKETKVASRLFTHNADVDFLNNQELERIDTPAVLTKMLQTGTPFMIDILKSQCLSPENLYLKVGAVVMFTRNNFDAGYVNGTLGKVVDFVGASPVVEIHSGERITAVPAEWTIEENGYVRARITQIPLRLAWAITVHKSQGMSLDAAKIDLSKAFEYGQGYVAISRVKSLDGLYLDGMNKRALEMHPKVVVQDKLFKEMSDQIK